MVVKNLVKGIVSLCHRSGGETVDLRKQIVSSLVVSLLNVDRSTADNASKALRKVCSTKVYYVTIFLILWI